jgi:hypothetical protein
MKALIKLKDELLQFEGSVTSVLLSSDGGTITGKGDASLYGVVYLTYNFTPNPTVPDQGVMNGIGTGIDGNGNMNTGNLNGVYRRKGNIIKIYCVDDITDGNVNIAVVDIDLKSGKIVVKWSQIDE